MGNGRIAKAVVARPLLMLLQHRAVDVVLDHHQEQRGAREASGQTEVLAASASRRAEVRFMGIAPGSAASIAPSTRGAPQKFPIAKHETKHKRPLQVLEAAS